MQNVLQILPLRRLVAIAAAAALFTAMLAGVAPMLAFAADCPTTHVDPNCRPGQPNPDRPPPPDPCAVLTHIPPECHNPDPDDDPDDCANIMTHVPEHCLKPDPDDCTDVATHVAEECKKPDPGDEPDGGQDGDDSGKQGDDDSTSTDTGPKPEAMPNLPNTGGNFLAFTVPGGALTVAAAVSLFRTRRRRSHDEA